MSQYVREGRRESRRSSSSLSESILIILRISRLTLARIIADHGADEMAMD
jgi:hypothetical protein